MSAFDDMKEKESDPAEALALMLPLLEYQPLTGNFIRRRTTGGQKSGTVAGTLDKKGYVQIRVEGRVFMAHRLAWIFTCGQWPDGQIDHINGNPSDNRFINLRVVSNRENQQNQYRHRDGHPVGVSFVKRTGRWQARTTDQGVYFHLGNFATAAEASLAYQLALKDLAAGYAETENRND